MDQLFQLHKQIQDLRQEVSTINQVANQLQRAEANNAAQLQRLQQNEVISTQQLQNIQQMCNRINQEVNVISNVAQQVSSQMVNRPFTSGQYGANIGSQFATGQFGNMGTIGTMATAGLYNPNQFSSYGSTQVAPTDLSSLANYWGQGLNPQDISISSQYLSNQNKQFMPQSYGAATYATGITQNIPYQYGTTGITGSQYIPSYSTSLSTPNQFGTSLSAPNQFGTSLSAPNQFGTSLSAPNQFGTSLSTPNQFGTSLSTPNQFGTSLSTPNQFGTSLSAPNQFGTGMVGTQSANMLGTQYIGSSF
ncbi:hypothetical protein Psfp_04058 [Pelotomaculum sp. FP]|uniref:hypothetical protein n=1 Tax=Pelotomaculum sp. FP TaxID=261474 RepID=UPI001064D6E2|nr:hypothetical protein [Pelotomaculum sp. FP]TEB11006.1 hypothetical protein Psfp_04058 [Pelotomaculum sp. FP]